MVPFRRIGLALVVLLTLPGSLARSDVVLTDGGKPTCTIVISDKASAPEAFAAEELRDYIRKISGATIPIATTADNVNKPMIVIGTKQSNPLIPYLDPSIAFSAREEDCDAFVVRTREGNLLLIGANERSCLYAAYDLLEDELNVFWPDIFSQDEIVPAQKTIKLGKIDRREAATFKYRGYTGGGNAIVDVMGKWKMNYIGVPYRRCDDEANWKTYYAQLQKRGIKFYSSHHGFHYFLPPKKYFKEHPEYFSLRAEKQKDGKKVMKRQPTQFCTYNDEALKIYTDGCMGFVKRHPEVDLFCPGPNDGYSWCICDKCGGDQRWQVKGQYQFGSDRLMHVVNAVAKRAAVECPGKPIVYFGYVATGEVPKIEKPLPNVTAALAFFERSASDLTSSAPYGSCEDIEAYYRNNIEQWTKLVPEVTIYEYYCGRGAWHCRPFIRTTAITNSLRFLAEKDVKGLIVQAPYNWWRAYVSNHYLLGKLLWNVNDDSQTVIKTFCQRRYGQAAPAMVDYFTHLDGKDNAQCESDIKRAERLANNAEIVNLIQYQQLLLKWRRLSGVACGHYYKAIELVKAHKRDDAIKVYQHMVADVEKAQAFLGESRIDAVIGRPTMYTLKDILENKYKLDKTPQKKK